MLRCKMLKIFVLKGFACLHCCTSHSVGKIHVASELINAQLLFYGWMDGQTGGRMDGRTDGGMDLKIWK